MSSVEPETAPAEVEAAPTPVDDPFQSVIQTLQTELGTGFVASEGQRGDLWVRVAVDAWKKAAEVLRFQLGYDYFSFLSAIDWMPHTWPNPKVVEGDGDGEAEEEPEPAPAVSAEDGWQTGVAGGDTRFQLLARVYSISRKNSVLLKCDLDDEAPQAPTWHEVYPGADWHERETWEMFGIEFAGHPGLRHLYLPSGFEGFPLRKDFPLLSREVKPWPGLVDVEGFPAGYGGDDAAEEG